MILQCKVRCMPWLFRVLPRANRHVSCYSLSRRTVLVSQASHGYPCYTCISTKQALLAPAPLQTCSFMIKLSMSPTPVRPYPLEGLQLEYDLIVSQYALSTTLRKPHLHPSNIAPAL